MDHSHSTNTSSSSGFHRLLIMFIPSFILNCWPCKPRSIQGVSKDMNSIHWLCHFGDWPGPGKSMAMSRCPSSRSNSQTGDHISSLIFRSWIKTSDVRPWSAESGRVSNSRVFPQTKALKNKTPKERLRRWHKLRLMVSDVSIRSFEAKPTNGQANTACLHTYICTHTCMLHTCVRAYRHPYMHANTHGHAYIEKGALCWARFLPHLHMFLRLQAKDDALAWPTRWSRNCIDVTSLSVPFPGFEIAGQNQISMTPHNKTRYVSSMQLRLKMSLVHRCVTVVQLLCAPSPANFDGKLMHSRASERPGCAVARLVVAASNLHRTAPWPKKLCRDLDQKCWDLCDRCVYQCVLIGPSPNAVVLSTPFWLLPRKKCHSSFDPFKSCGAFRSFRCERHSCR